MDTASKNRLAKVHPLLAERVNRAINQLALIGREVRVVQGLRTYAEQDALFAKGRTKPGQVVTMARGGKSNHNFGLAVDLCPVNDGKFDWDDLDGFNAIGAAAFGNSLAWGGRWVKFLDLPHVELPTKLKVAECHRLFTKGGLQAVWDKANQILGTISAAPANTHSEPQTNKGQDHSPAKQPTILTIGDEGPEVAALQKALGIKADGVFGRATRRAVEAAQRNAGLRVDGKVGPATRKELDL